MIEEKDKDFSVYEVPMSLVEHGMDELIVRKLSLKAGPLNLDHWRDLLHRLRNPEHEISIAVVGKYAEHRDAYKSIYEALDHAGVHHRAQVRIRAHPQRGRGTRGAGAPVGRRRRHPRARRVRRTGHRRQGRRGPFRPRTRIPFFGICLGMQCAVAEFARNVVGLERANSTEFDKDTPNPVICLLDEQKTITDKGGTMRLGAQPTRLAQGSRAAACYGTREHLRASPASLRVQQHLPPAVPRLRDALHGHQPGRLRWWKSSKIPDHPWFVGVQYHPEFKSQPTKAHPLFAGFVGAAIRHHDGG